MMSLLKILSVLLTISTLAKCHASSRNKRSIIPPGQHSLPHGSLEYSFFIKVYGNKFKNDVGEQWDHYRQNVGDQFRTRGCPKFRMDYKKYTGKKGISFDHYIKFLDESFKKMKHAGLAKQRRWLKGVEEIVTYRKKKIEHPRCCDFNHVHAYRKWNTFKEELTSLIKRRESKQVFEV